MVGGRENIGDLGFQADALAEAFAFDGLDRSVSSGEVVGLGRFGLIQHLLKFANGIRIDRLWIALLGIGDEFGPGIADFRPVFAIDISRWIAESGKGAL